MIATKYQVTFTTEDVDIVDVLGTSLSISASTHQMAVTGITTVGSMLSAGDIVEPCEIDLEASTGGDTTVYENFSGSISYESLCQFSAYCGDEVAMSFSWVSA
jgi:hypothetical protein